jgi:hypothetical protein
MLRRPRRATQILSGAAIVCLLGLSFGAGAVATNAMGVGDKFDHLIERIDRLLAGPPPDRQTVGTVLVDDGTQADADPDDTGDPGVDGSSSPDPTPSPTPRATLAPGASPTPTPAPTPTPTPAPERKKIDLDIESKPKSVFASEIEDTWCAPAGVQMALGVMGLADNSDAFQKELQRKVRTWESYKDSHNGDWGPAAMVLALDAYGAPGYEVRAYKARSTALRDAARAIQETHAPVLLMAWRGAHTWVMTGFRADADPSIFQDANVTGAYILDPWYPRVSSIWGPSDPPGTFQNASEMERNYLKWRRPEGHYADRDGLYIAVVPTIPLAGA